MMFDWADTLQQAAAGLADGTPCLNCGHPIGFHLLDPDQCTGGHTTDGGCECCEYNPAATT